MARDYSYETCNITLKCSPNVTERLGRCQDSWPIVIIMEIKSRTLKRERHVTRIAEMINARKFYSVHTKGRVHYATSQKVVGSIPDEVLEFYQFT
jgi:hypothetical protein